jgi:hypothetical protein
MQTYLGDYAKKDAYKKVQNHKDTDVQRNVVYQIIKCHPEGITDMEISIITGISRSSINGRRNELPDVKPVGYAKIVDSWGDRLNTLWGVKVEEEIC